MDFDFEVLRDEGIVLCLNVMIIGLFCFLEFVLFLVVLVNSVLPLGWDISHKTLKVMSVVYKYHLYCVLKKLQKTELAFIQC